MNKANKASSDLYKLNADFFNVSTSLTAKSDKIGRSKDRALDLQKRANNLANSASSKLASLLDMEKEYEDNQRQLDILSIRLIELNCKMQIHLLVSIFCFKAVLHFIRGILISKYICAIGLQFLYLTRTNLSNLSVPTKCCK